MRIAAGAVPITNSLWKGPQDRLVFGWEIRFAVAGMDRYFTIKGQ